MTISSEITRLQWAKSDIKTAIENKWVTVPSNITIDEYAPYIDKIWWGDVYKGEYIEFKAYADASWYLRIPIWWYNNTTGSRDCAYSWKISVDWGAETTYSWTGGNGNSITLGWYTANSLHTVKIVPTTESYWWARAYWWENTGWRARITKIIYDSSYMWYAVSATDTGNHFRNSQYRWCTNLVNAPAEYMPDTVTTIWTYFRSWQYNSCSALMVAADEVMPDSVTSIWNGFRQSQYAYGNVSIGGKECLSNNITSIPNNFRDSQYSWAALIEAPIEVMWDKVTSIWNWFRQNQYNSCRFLQKPNEYIPSSVTTIWQGFRFWQYFWCFSLTASAMECLPSSVTSVWASFRGSQYGRCPNLVCVSWWQDREITVWSSYRSLQFAKQRTTNVNVHVIWNPCNIDSDSNVFDNTSFYVYADSSSNATAIKNSTHSPRNYISDSNIYSLG